MTVTESSTAAGDVGSAARPTMVDVARAAGVSLKTVSRVINNEPHVSSEVVDRVRQAATALGYRRHEGARQLRRGRSGTLGAVVRDITDPACAALVHHAQRAATSVGLLLTTASLGGDVALELPFATTLCRRQVDGLLLTPVGSTQSYLDAEACAGLPIVAVGAPIAGVLADEILSDDTSGIYAALEQLQRAGHERIGYLGPTAAGFEGAERQAAFRHGITRLRADRDGRLVQNCGVESATIRAALDQLRDEEISALVLGGGEHTAEVLRQLAESTWRPALVGFDTPPPWLSRPRLVATINTDWAELGRRAVRLITTRLEEPGRPRRRVRVPTSVAAST